jgi:hypothetical protein
MLIHKKAVRKLALALAGGKRDRVSQRFLDHIEAALREAVSKRVTHHDNVCGSRRTLV